MRSESFRLLSERLNSISDESRKSSREAIDKIIDQIRQSLSSEGDLAAPALVAVTSISSSCVPGEEIKMTETVPLIVSKLKAGTNVRESLAALVPLWYARQTWRTAPALNLPFSARKSVRVLFPSSRVSSRSRLVYCKRLLYQTKVGTHRPTGDAPY